MVGFQLVCASRDVEKTEYRLWKETFWVVLISRNCTLIDQTSQRCNVSTVNSKHDKFHSHWYVLKNVLFAPYNVWSLIHLFIYSSVIIFKNTMYSIIKQRDKITLDSRHFIELDSKAKNIITTIYCLKDKEIKIALVAYTSVRTVVKLFKMFK